MSTKEKTTTKRKTTPKKTTDKKTTLKKTTPTEPKEESKTKPKREVNIIPVTKNHGIMCNDDYAIDVMKKSGKGNWRAVAHHNNICSALESVYRRETLIATSEATELKALIEECKKIADDVTKAGRKIGRK